MFSFYGDDSEQTGSSIVALGGYLGKEESWEIVEDELPRVYDKYGISYFHAKKFHATRGEFEGWDGSKKADFCEEMFAVVKRAVECGVCVCMSKSSWKSMRRAHPKTSSMSAYGVAFKQLANMTATGSKMPIPEIPRPVSIFMEAGCTNTGEFVAAFNQMQKNDLYGRNVKDLRFVGKLSCRAVQVADFLAFYGRKYGKILYDLGRYDEEQMPHALRIAVRDIPHCINVMRGDATRDGSKVIVGPSQAFYLGPATKPGG